MISLKKKICLMGDFSVGKTSLVRRFIYNRFDDRYISTIGVKVSRKTVNLSKRQDLVEVAMMIWDLAGGEEFNHVQGSYLRGADGAILVCDRTRPATLELLDTQAHNFFRVNPEAKIVIAANKSDLINQICVPDDTIEAFAQKYDTRHFFTSAKTGDDVESAFRCLAELL
jgi:small GTP-binding protein